MLLSALLWGLGLSALIAARPLPPGAAKITTIPAYNVTDFAAAALVMSNRVYYRFNLTFCPDLAPITCFALGTTLNEDLSSTPLTRCGEGEHLADPNVSVFFKWTRAPDGSSSLLLTRNVGDGDSQNVIEEAAYLVPANHTPTLGEGQFRHMVYSGPESFSVPAFRFEIA